MGDARQRHRRRTRRIALSRAARRGRATTSRSSAMSAGPTSCIHELGQHELLVVIQGPHGYISPGWYGDAANVPDLELHLGAPHRHPGAALSPRRTCECSSGSSRPFEGGMPQPRRCWQPPNDPDYVDQARAGTIGLRLTPTKVVAKRKMSQNRPDDVVERSSPSSARERAPTPTRACAGEMQRDARHAEGRSMTLEPRRSRRRHRGRAADRRRTDGPVRATTRSTCTSPTA